MSKDTEFVDEPDTTYADAYRAEFESVMTARRALAMSGIAMLAGIGMMYGKVPTPFPNAHLFALFASGMMFGGAGGFKN